MDLKKCPFCGGKIKVLPVDMWGAIKDETYIAPAGECTRYVLVHTVGDNDTCPIATAPRDALGYYDYESKEEAAEAWNERI